MSAEPTTARGKAIVEAAREMADAKGRSACAYEHGDAWHSSLHDKAADEARAELERLVAEWEAES